MKRFGCLLTQTPKFYDYIPNRDLEFENTSDSVAINLTSFEAVWVALVKYAVPALIIVLVGIYSYIFETKFVANICLKRNQAATLSQTPQDKKVINHKAQVKQNAASEPKPISYGDKMVMTAKKYENYTEAQMERVCEYDLPDNLWCAAFVKFVATKVFGSKLPSWYLDCGYNSCINVFTAASRNNAVIEDYKKAKPGDIVIFKTKDSQAGHMGIAVSINKSSGTLKVIEGNISGKVKIETYNLNEKNKVNSFIRLVNYA